MIYYKLRRGNRMFAISLEKNRKTTITYTMMNSRSFRNFLKKEI